MHEILSGYFREELQLRIWEGSVPGRPHMVLLGYMMVGEQEVKGGEGLMGKFVPLLQAHLFHELVLG